MKINITKKEYKLLIELMYLGDFIINSMATDVGSNGSLEHQQIYQKFLSYAKEMGLEDSIKYDSESGEYYETAEYEMNLQKNYLEPYEEDSFWADLIYQFSLRDAIAQYGEEKFNNLERMERFSAIATYEKQYQEEFENFGLSRFKILKYNA